MPATTTQLLEFLDTRSSGTIIRHEIHSAAFSDLRHSLRSMIVRFHESEDLEAKEISGHLRSVLSKWLTVPAQFDDTILHTLNELGEPVAVESRWGRDIRGYYEDARQSATELIKVKNPLRNVLIEHINDIQESRRPYRIFCHRRSREHFESLSNSSVLEKISKSVFLHTVVDYREVETFDILLKVGPLRSRGWGAIPDAVLTAPRFDTLIQVVWSGCYDASDFGYDPVSAQLSDWNDSPRDMTNHGHDNPILQLHWDVREIESKDSSVGRFPDIADENDLDVLDSLARPADLHRATLLQVVDEYGIFYPPSSRVLSFDGDPITIDYRLPENLTEGMFFILPALEDANLAELQAEEGYFSRTWKEKLHAEYQRDPEGLVNRLWDNGLLLLGLQSRLETWCVPATTVIPAPQKEKHFEILINVLGIDFEDGAKQSRYKASWWQYAWGEIRRSRGVAIQTGVQEHQILDDQVETVTRLLEEEIRRNTEKSIFSLKIPTFDDFEISGTILFLKILAIENDFMVPQGDLRILCNLDKVDQWRA